MHSFNIFQTFAFKIIKIVHLSFVQDIARDVHTFKGALKGKIREFLISFFSSNFFRLFARMLMRMSLSRI